MNLIRKKIFSSKTLFYVSLFSSFAFGSISYSAETNLGFSAEGLVGSTDNLVSFADTHKLIFDELDCEGARSCTDDEFDLYLDIAKIVDTAFGGANDLSTGPDGLRATLYWFSTEESASQGELANEVNSSQVGSINSRLSALRAIVDINTASLTSLSPNASGGSAGDGLTSKWGGFANYGTVDGDKEQTDFTDALEFDGNKLSLGADYRLNSNWVLGASAGYDKVDSSILRTDFDVSDTLKPRIADGKTNLESNTVSLYTMYENDKYYLSGIASHTSLNYEMERLIAYQSNNSSVSGGDDLAKSSTDGSQLNLGVNAGVTFNQGSLSESIDIGYAVTSTTIDAYTETGAGILNFRVDQQKIDSSILSLQAKISKVFSTESGVFIPFLRARLIKQLDEDQYEITARYDAFDSDAKFSVLTDIPESEFAVIGAGVTAVFQNDVQAFVSLSSIQGYDNLTATQMDAGIRIGF